MNTPETTPHSPGASARQSAPGIGRRQIVRAGLSAAPVVAILKSNTVLAGTVGGGAGNAIAPSAFASLQANQGRASQSTYKTDFKVRTPEEWVSKTSPLKKEKFRELGFTANPGRKYGPSVTVEQVLTDNENSREAVLARYVVASYLTAREFNDSRDVLALTTSQCNAIWNGQGAWSPFAGARWDYAQTIAYFETIYGKRGYG